MEYADTETAIRRAEQVQAMQAGIMDEWEASLIGREIPVLCEYWDDAQALFVGRGYFDSPGIDGRVLFFGLLRSGSHRNR
jgi:tRNA A37 methylthiotransferase MiaB